MTAEELEILREKLPNAYQAKIQERTGYSQSYISQVLLGNRSNEVIIDVAIDIANAHQRKLQSRSKKIKSL